jgi:hypothetical protein
MSGVVRNPPAFRHGEVQIKIYCPPINLNSKPWQHAFDKRYYMSRTTQSKHDTLKLYWERSGRPPLEFKYGDDPWLEVAGTPSWNPAFDYRIRGVDTAISKNTAQYDEGYKHGYAEALAAVITLLRARQ